MKKLVQSKSLIAVLEKQVKFPQIFNLLEPEFYI